MEDLVAKWNVNEYLRNIVGGLALVGLIFLLGDKYAGLGVGTIEKELNGQQYAFWYDFLFKMLFTIITLSFGGSGGVVTPMFFIGVSAGSCFAQIMHVDNATFAAIGMVSLLSGAANTPIAASIMGLEIFGPAVAPYAAISCVIAFLMTGHRSIYPSQILSMKKTASVQVNIGGEMHDIETSISSRARHKLYRPWKFFK